MPLSNSNQNQMGTYDSQYKSGVFCKPELSQRKNLTLPYQCYFGHLDNILYKLANILYYRATLKIFLFTLTRPCFAGMGLSVGSFFNYSYWIQKCCYYQDLLYCIMQVKSITELFLGAILSAFI